MKEEEIRPSILFKKYLELCQEDIKNIFHEEKFHEFNCPACGNEGETSFIKNSFTYKECRYCNTLFVSPRPSKDAFENFYTKSKSAKFWATDFYRITEESRREKLWKPKVKKIKKIIERFDLQNASLIDIGGGYGVFAEEIISLGIKDIIVIEPSLELAKICINKGLNVINKFLEDVVISDLPSGKLLYLSFELFEHLHSPDLFMKSLHNVMKKDDYFFFTTLSGNGIDIRVLWENSESVSPPHHLNFFNPKSVKILLEKSGFDFVEFSTPGKLDLDIMSRNKLIKSDNFWNIFFKNASEDARNEFQEVFSKYGFSSHMHILSKKL